MLINADFYVLLPQFFQFRLWHFYVDIHGILDFFKQDSPVQRGMISTPSFHDALMHSI
jgi:hypothetical protein